ncbi:unnamed protein product [Didymodactylos carnosus]|uniref:Uncharacterized protein n=1 Tax=Didymodactylos carnosus TaxID=1234261 RepID=A0A814F3K7_9BILA|nr:unnamed protein product [Didymodactylos carnosus]CAF1070992.1 unnamed protein product [Didymodactylos carnosus]CAF3750427.1 unnamed protein product [Didymodactylos carnosus]CAF3835347.1 unnamed protein product [Didymodactylos carnosus]
MVAVGENGFESDEDFYGQQLDTPTVTGNNDMSTTQNDNIEGKTGWPYFGGIEDGLTVESGNPSTGKETR